MCPFGLGPVGPGRRSLRNETVIEWAVSIYDPSLPVAFHCPQCKKNQQLRGGEAEKQTPAYFSSHRWIDCVSHLPRSLSP